MNYEIDAATMGHIDAGMVYKHTGEAACKWHNRYAMRRRFPADGVTHDQLEKSYRLYYVGTWNALVAMDEAAAAVGLKPIRADFAEIKRG